jgi:sn-glycerol 3-phosphate transport system substrate-binding protein
MKHVRKLRIAFAALAVLSMSTLALAAPVTVNWWHAHGGALGERVNTICDGFNKYQTQYQVVPTYKGNYADTMNAGIAAFRAKTPPHILQVFEVGTATMMAAKGAVKPVYEVMKESGLPFDPKVYLPTVTGYYTTTDGRMISMPFNSSTPVLYYNVEMFKKAGLDPEKPPGTWPAVGETARKLLAAGVCQAGLSSAWNGWIHLENLGPWHNVPFGTKANGFGGLDARYTFNTPLYVKHIQQLADWQKDKIFIYGGRTNIGNAKFSSGEVAMYTESSAGYAGFKKTCQFEFGTAMLPYWPDQKGAPQNTIIGGASLWVLRGHKPEEYKGVAAFFNYLSRPEVQAEWHQATGYLPITLAAYELTKKQGFYEKNPGTETALKQMTLHKPTENSKGIRFGDHAKTREIMDNEFEAIFSGQKTAKQGLDDAVKAGNELLVKFEKANK